MLNFKKFNKEKNKADKGKSFIFFNIVLCRLFYISLRMHLKARSLISRFTRTKYGKSEKDSTKQNFIPRDATIEINIESWLGFLKPGLIILSGIFKILGIRTSCLLTRLSQADAQFIPMFKQTSSFFCLTLEGITTRSKKPLLTSHFPKVPSRV